MIQSTILTTKKDSDYELLDSGEGQKLERFGNVILSRPDPQVLWHKELSKEEWQKSDGYFDNGEWKLNKNVPSDWQIEMSGLKFLIKPTAFKHTGIFPEQLSNWEWLKGVVKEGTEVLNLFGYTGGASLICAKAGAKVVHVDSSKSAITWAKENAKLSGLADKPIRWILDDAQAFVEREIKRGRKYDGIIMDPPSFGHGPNNELWKIEEHFLNLMDNCLKKLLSDKPIFFLVSGYSAGYSAIAYKNSLFPLQEKLGGSVEYGELTIQESRSERLLPCGIFARWSTPEARPMG
ncbi:MAG: class I SAM-dependent methyltransferase [Patescibacteria group bacterium]|nr:class I SAM-dependent methyltransferase [Patescibacteria group bacterium]